LTVVWLIELTIGRLKGFLEVGALLKRGVAMTMERTTAGIGNPTGGVAIGDTEDIVAANIHIMAPGAIPLTRIVMDGKLRKRIATILCHGVLGVCRTCSVLGLVYIVRFNRPTL
jgi:hypothetical protein